MKRYKYFALTLSGGILIGCGIEYNNAIIGWIGISLWLISLFSYMGEDI